MEIRSIFKLKYEKNIISIVDLKKTVFLKTAIIANELIISLNKDIFEGPKYLKPLIELTEFSFKICFLTDPEKLLHKLILPDRILTSFFVKQL